MSIAIIHLLWGPAGPEPVRRFADAYRVQDAGADHRLVLLFNGFDDDAIRQGARACFEGLPCDELHIEQRCLDLAAYAHVVGRTSEERLLFLGAYAEPLAVGWLASLDAQLARDGVGIVGPTGSLESGLSPAPWLYKPGRVARFPRFPSPHIRTGAFMLDRVTLERIRWPAVRTKVAAWALESGRRSLTRQIQAMGLRPLVVGRDGRGYEVAEWPASATFRSGNQANLLIADNRTRQWAEANPAERRRLTRMAWGGAA